VSVDNELADSTEILARTLFLSLCLPTEVSSLAPGSNATLSVSGSAKSDVVSFDLDSGGAW
jgi:hypothetical protein